MLDRVTGWWPEGGSKRLGYLRAEKDVDPGEWFFKAHFFQDPVQPGSLGVEALCQLLQLCMLERGMANGLASPRFEPLMLGRAVTWKYRGQVVPSNRTITTELELTEVGDDERGRYAVADAWLWVDGTRIYAVQNLGMRIVAATARDERDDNDDEVLDPAVDAWLGDHRPTFTMPALPMMSMVDRLARGVARRTGRAVVALRDVQVLRWLPFPGGPVRLRTEISGSGDMHAATLLAWREAGDPRFSRFEPVASARVLLASTSPRPSHWRRSTSTRRRRSMIPTPRARSFTARPSTTSASCAEARTAPRRARRRERTVPRSLLHQGLLDAATHAIPHDELWRWSPEIPRDVVAYPYRIPEIRLLAPLPDHGALRLEARVRRVRRRLALPRDRPPDPRRSAPAGGAPPRRSAAAQGPDRHGSTCVAPRVPARPEARPRHWTVACRRRGDSTRRARAPRQRLAARQRGTHLRRSLFARRGVARRGRRPRSRRAEGLRASLGAPRRPRGRGARGSVRRARGRAAAAPAPGSARSRVATQCASSTRDPPVQDLEPVRMYWRERIGVGPWPIEDLYYGLVARCVGDVVIADPDAFAMVQGRSCLYLGNHQVGIESLLFSVLLSALSGTHTLTLAKAEHRTSWLGTLIAHSFAYPGVTDPRLITFFDREDRDSLLGVIGEIAAEMRAGAKSAMVHVRERARSRAAAPSRR
jgi:3-hydroxymyristoyl/3-hydroxydecanoyl-(acyl carrier protein) dehydratase